MRELSAPGSGLQPSQSAQAYDPHLQLPGVTWMRLRIRGVLFFVESLPGSTSDFRSRRARHTHRPMGKPSPLILSPENPRRHPDLAPRTAWPTSMSMLVKSATRVLVMSRPVYHYPPEVEPKLTKQLDWLSSYINRCFALSDLDNQGKSAPLQGFRGTDNEHQPRLASFMKR